MDQLAPILKGMYQNRFWIVCGLIAAVSLGTWYFVSSTQSKERESRQSDIQRRDLEIKGVLGTSASLPLGMAGAVSVHPNTQTKEGMDQQIKAATDTAVEAWLIREQQQEPHLTYPTDQIGEHVADPLRKLNPLESVPEGYEVPENLRDTYKFQIANRMSEIKETFGVNWKYDDQQTKGDTPTAGSANIITQQDLGTDAVVIWNENNQEIWYDKLTQFANKFGNTSSANRPTTMQILVLQQDIWVLTAILNIIKQVNGDADQRDLAAVKDIDHILVGRDAKRIDLGQIHNASLVEAADPSQSTERKPKTDGGLARGSRKATQEAARAGARQRGGMADTGQFNWDGSTSPIHGRYVDRDFQPLAADEVKNAVQTNQLTDKAYLAVAKRIPVRVAVRMDERDIEKFLAAAANSPFVFEIRQVRINKHEPNQGYVAESSGGGASSGSGRGGRGGDRPGLKAGGGGAAGGSAALGPEGDERAAGRSGAVGSGTGGTDPSEIPAEQRTNYDVNVEFFGIVKLYNPVNEELFGRTSDSGSGGPPPATGGASPASNRP